VTGGALVKTGINIMPGKTAAGKESTRATAATRIEAIVSALAVFLDPDQWTELRALNMQGARARGRFYHTGQLDDLARQALTWEADGASGVYFVPNPLRSDVQSSPRLATDADVIARHWLLIDCDPVRFGPDGQPLADQRVPATDAERAAAWTVLDRCQASLETAGKFHNAVVCASGNGWHLCYRLDLANDDTAKEQIRQLLRGLNERCGDERARVDTSTFNASRIWKCPGTVSRKGMESQDRPYQMAWKVEGERTDPNNNAALARMLHIWRMQEDARRGPGREKVGERQALIERARLYAAKEPPAVSGQGGHNRAFHVVCQLLLGFDLSQEEAFWAVQDWNARCAPPWSEAELRHKLADAEKAPCDKPRGWLLREGHNGQANGAHANGQAAAAKPETFPVILTFSAIQARAVEWLWRPWIPLGALTLLDGDPGLGKSTIAVDLAARVSVGYAMPPDYGNATDPADVLILSAEDDPHTTIRPRLDAAGADLARVHTLTAMRVGNAERPPVLPYDLSAIAGMIRAKGIRLVIVDSFMAFLDSKIDSHRDQDVRRCLHQLKLLAERTLSAILIIRHLNKLMGGSALYRGGGSIGIIGAVRAALIVGHNPANPEQGVLAPVKCNLAKKPPALLYAHQPVGRDVSRIGWLGETNLTANDILDHPGGSQKQSTAHECAAAIREILGSGVMESGELDAQLRERGYTLNAIREGRRQAGVKVNRVGFGPEARYMVSLPAEDADHA
jgi:hypothetical protein